jgi:L-ascorbate 6-phosphate lactonase
MVGKGLKPIYKSGKPLLQEIQETKLPEGGVAIWSLGQAGVLIKGSASDEIILYRPLSNFFD